jgi:predicted transcriptional regulator
MSSVLVELTANIVSSHAASVEMSSEELLLEIQKVYQALKQLDNATLPEGETAKPVPVMSAKKSIQKDQVVCLICNKGGFKTLTRHLKQVHDMKPGAYRKQFGMAAGTPLTAKNYSEARREAAKKINLGANLEKARATRMANLAAKKAVPAKGKKVAAAAPAKAKKVVAPAKAKKK